MAYALVTGASGGIGLELARLLAGEGYDLVLVARSRTKLEALADDLETKHGVTTQVMEMDLTRPEAPGELVRRLAARGIEVEILINNAGFGAYGEFAATPWERDCDMIRLNITALAELTKLLVPAMVGRRSGRILNVASTAAFQPGPLMAVYYATKAFVLSFSEAIGSELEGTGVTVTALCPGPTRTGFQATARLEGTRLLQMGLTMDAAAVARSGYRALRRGRQVVIPGWKNRLLVQSLRITPRSVVTRMVRLVQQRVAG